MDQCQKIPALHSLEGHVSCQPFCALQLQLLSQSLVKELHIMPQKFPHSEWHEVFTSTFPAGKRNCICHPAFPGRTKPFVLCCSSTASEWGGKKSCLFFPGRLAYSNAWIFAVSRRGFANKRRTELYLRHASSWKLSNTLLLFLIRKCPSLEEVLFLCGNPIDARLHSTHSVLTHCRLLHAGDAGTACRVVRDHTEPEQRQNLFLSVSQIQLSAHCSGVKG